MFLRKKYVNRILRYLEIVNVVFLVGGRQVGKTSILKSLIYFGLLDKEKTFYLNFDEFLISGNIVFDTLKDFVSFLEIEYKIDFNKIEYFLFDEVGNLKNFNLLLKALVDKYPDKKFICTSSGNYLWLNEIIEGLAGRALELVVYPLDFEEFLQFKGVEYKKINSNVLFERYEKYFLEYVSFGAYPKVVLSKNEDKYLVLKSILESVIIRDIKSFLKQEQIIDFIKLVKFLSLGIGSKFSYESLSDKLGIKKNFVSKYLFLLENIFLVKFLEPYYTDKKSEISSKRKIYFLDFGIMNFYNRSFGLKTVWTGKDLEMFIFLQLLFNLSDMENLYFYQTLNGNEIDFIFERNGKLVPIEVKSSNKDNIPKIFKFFCQKYFDKINYFIKITKFIEKDREIENCLVKFISMFDKFES